MYEHIHQNETRAVALRQVEKDAIALLVNRFENPDKPLDILPYHNVAHTKAVVKRVEHLMAAINGGKPGTFSRRDAENMSVAALFHDVVQNYNIEEQREGEHIIQIRKRHIGSNEQASAEEARAYMLAQNGFFRNSIFSQEDINIVTAAILATIPTGSPQSKVGLPGVLEYADIGGIVLQEAKSVVTDGAQLFLEDNIDIAVRYAQGDEFGISDKERILSWIQNQHGFVDHVDKASQRIAEEYPHTSLFTERGAKIQIAHDALEQEVKRLGSLNPEDGVKSYLSTTI